MGVRECGWWWWGDLCWETRACAFARAGVPVRHCYCSCSFPSSAGGSPSLSCRHCVSLFLSIMCSRVNLILQVPLDLRPLPAAAPTLPGRAQLRCRRISLPNLGAAMFPADLHAMRAPCAVGKHGPVHLAGDIGAWDRNQAPLASSSNGRVLFFSCWPRGSSNIYPRSITPVKRSPHTYRVASAARLHLSRRHRVVTAARVSRAQLTYIACEHCVGMLYCVSNDLPVKSSPHSCRVASCLASPLCCDCSTCFARTAHVHSM
jgi:hypothetical protein